MRLKSFRGWFRNLALARKLILINVVFIVLPLGLMGYFAFARFTETTERKVGDYRLQTLKQLTLNIDTYMNEPEPADRDALSISQGDRLSGHEASPRRTPDAG